MTHNNITILTIALILLVIAFCIENFKTLRDITKWESIRGFLHNTLNSLGLALIVGIVSIQLFQANVLNEIKPQNECPSLTMSPSDLYLLNEFDDPFRWENPKVEAHLSVNSDNSCLYKYRLSYTVKNYSEVPQAYSIKHKITSLIEDNPHVKISELEVSGSDKYGKRNRVNLLNSKDTIIRYSSKGMVWQAVTNIPEITLLPNEEIFVSGLFEYFDYLDHGTQIFSASRISNNLEYNVTYDPNIFEISIIPLINNRRSEAFVENSKRESILTGSTTNKCFIGSGMFSYQAVVLSYRAVRTENNINSNKEKVKVVLGEKSKVQKKS